MSFERIKTIKGKKYGYKVESYREDGKIKQRILEYHGRIDKPKNEVLSGKFIIPESYITNIEKEDYLNEMIDVGASKLLCVVSSTTYERLFRRRVTPEETMDDVITYMLDTIHKRRISNAKVTTTYT
jgi:hypothetical protein